LEIKRFTLLEILEEYPDTETTIRQYDDTVGVCMVCKCLFKTIEEIEDLYHVSLKELAAEIEQKISVPSP